MPGSEGLMTAAALHQQRAPLLNAGKSFYWCDCLVLLALQTKASFKVSAATFVVLWCWPCRVT
jgi:hypothetical protein